MSAARVRLTALAICWAISRARGSRSLASHLQSRLGLKGLKAALLIPALAMLLLIAIVLQRSRLWSMRTVE